jgi:ERCC4-related helicase
VPPRPLRPGDTVRIRGERWRVTTSDGSIIHVRGRDVTNREASAAFLLAAEQLERIADSPLPRALRPRQWRRAVRGVLAEAVPSFDSLRTAARAQLAVLPFQLEPAIAVTRGIGVRLLIADEVGLGKTVQAGLIAAELLARTRAARVLIVAPAGLREQWALELRQRFGIAPVLIDSAALARSTSAALAGAHPWTTSPVGVTSIDFVKRPEVLRSLETLVWDLVIFDEAHALAGRTDRATAARALAERARTIVMLTATPHTGDDEAFVRLAGMGDIDGRFPLVVFRRTRRDAGLAASRHTTWLRVSPTSAERALHAALMAYATSVWRSRGTLEPAARLAMIVLARRACSSAGALARSIERRLSLLATHGVQPVPQLTLPFGDDDEADMALAAPGLSDLHEERRILADLLQLAGNAAVDESKPALLRRFLRRAGQPAIVFTEYRDTLTLLAAALSALEPVQLHGGLTASERRDVLLQFTRGTARLLLATDAASEGLNLHQRCRLVINLELPWTPLRLEQRVGRVERIGQRQTVHAVHLIAAGTAEETTVHTLLRRMDRVTAAVESMRQPPLGERDVAAVVFGQDAPAPATNPSALPSAVVVPDLRSIAASETERIVSARSLDPGKALTFEGRPIVTRTSRRRVPFACCCVYRLAFENENCELVWETVAGVASGTWSSTAPTSQALRVQLTAACGTFDPMLRSIHEEAARRLVASRRAPTELAIAREHAIIHALTERQARMAAALLQRGLFDRRAERAAAAQAAVLQEAVARCEAHLRDLSRVAHAMPADRALAFALFAG